MAMLAERENKLLIMKTSSVAIPIQDQPITKAFLVNEFNFLTHFYAHRFARHDKAVVLPKDVYPHLQYNHLLDVALPTHKIFEVPDEARPITKCGHSKGSKMKKEPSHNQASDSKQRDMKRHANTPDGLAVVAPKDEEGSKKAKHVDAGDELASVTSLAMGARTPSSYRMRILCWNYRGIENSRTIEF